MSGSWLALGGVLLAMAWTPPMEVTGAVSPEAEIVVTREPLAGGGDQVTAVAMYRGAGRGLTYRFTTLKEGASGRSRSVQQGEVGETESLATSSVRMNVGDVCTAHLELRRGTDLVGEVRWSGTGR